MKHGVELDANYSKMNICLQNLPQLIMSAVSTIKAIFNEIGPTGSTPHQSIEQSGSGRISHSNLFV